MGQRKTAPARRFVILRHRAPQKRFGIRPSFLNSAYVEAVFAAVTRQKGAVKVALNRLSRAVTEEMRALRERLFHVFPGGVIELAELGMPGAYLRDLSASTFSIPASTASVIPRTV